MTRRRLTPEEIALWHKVVEKTERLHPESATGPPRVLPKPKPAKSPLSRMDGFTLGQTAAPKPRRHDLKPALVDHLLTTPVQMDRKAFGRMKRGKLKPEGRIDLHGMTVDRAHPALVRFVLSAQASGKRLVLVTTRSANTSEPPGPIPVPHGVLKHQVPHWLSTPPLAQAVLQVSSAHISHGGTGALYVYLRRGR